MQKRIRRLIEAVREINEPIEAAELAAKNRLTAQACSLGGLAMSYMAVGHGETMGWDATDVFTLATAASFFLASAYNLRHEQIRLQPSPQNEPLPFGEVESSPSIQPSV